MKALDRFILIGMILLAVQIVIATAPSDPTTDLTNNSWHFNYLPLTCSGSTDAEGDDFTYEYYSRLDNHNTTAYSKSSNPDCTWGTPDDPSPDSPYNLTCKMGQSDGGYWKINSTINANYLRIYYYIKLNIGTGDGGCEAYSQLKIDGDVIIDGQNHDTTYTLDGYLNVTAYNDGQEHEIELYGNGGGNGGCWPGEYGISKIYLYEDEDWELQHNSTNTSYNFSGETYMTDMESPYIQYKCRACDNNSECSNYIGTYNLGLANFSQCDGNANPEYNFTFAHEINESINNITGDLDAIFSFGDNEFAYDLTGQNNYSFCLNGNATLTEAFIQYTSSGYDPRNYYLFNTQVDENTDTDILLHLLDITLATGTNFFIEDESGNPLSNLYLYIDRFIPGDNLYKTIAMGKTDSNGQEYIFLRHEDAWLQYKVYNSDGDLLFISSRGKISEIEGSTDQTITIGADTWSEYQDQFNDVLYSLTYSNATETFTLTFSTSSGEARNVCLKVVENKVGGYQFIEYDTCLNSASGTLFHQIANNQSTYFAEAYMTINPEWIFEILWAEPDTVQYWGTLGLLIVVGLIAFFAIIGASMGEFGVGIAMILSAIVLVIARLIGMISIGQGAVMAFLTIIGFMIVKMGAKNR